MGIKHAAHNKAKGDLILSSDFNAEHENVKVADIDNGAITGDKLSAGAEAAHIYPKVSSDNLRHSHDNEASTISTGDPPALLKTVTFNKGIKGTIRIRMDIKTENTNHMGIFWLYKNAVFLEEVQTVSETYETKSVDRNLGTFDPGDELNLKAYIKMGDGVEKCYAKNFRIYYDNDTKPVAVDGVSNS